MYYIILNLTNVNTTIDIIVKIMPAGAKLLAIKDINLALKIKFNIEAVPIIAKHPKEIKDEGTCTYIILTVSPWM